MNKNSDKTPSVAQGTTLDLPDGTTIELCDWIWEPLRSSFEVHALLLDHYKQAMLCTWEPFAHSRSMQISGGKRTITRADSNIPRAGSNGLPHRYEMLVFSWRAGCSLPMSPELRRFAASCSVELHYQDKNYSNTRLSDLLDAPRVFSDAGTLPAGLNKPDAPDAASTASLLPPFVPDVGLIVHMRENNSYGARVVAESMDELERFCAWLARGVSPRDAQLLDVLGLIEGTGAGTQLARKKINALITHPEPALFWIELEGAYKRPIV